MDEAPVPDPRLALLLAADIPILRSTARALARAAERRDHADLHSLAELALADPLLAVRVFALVARRFGARLATPVESVTGALLLTGLDPFLQEFLAAPVLEHALADAAPALAAARAVLKRSHVAARIAAAFAIHRQEPDVEEVQLAALLHDFAALLLLVVPPHEEVAEAECGTLGDALMQHWQLPPLLRALAYEGPRRAPAAHAVALAVRLARHRADPTAGAACQRDLQEAADFLQLNFAAAAALVRHALG